MVTLDYQNTSSEHHNQKTTPIDQQNELKMSEQEKHSQGGEQTPTQITATEVVKEKQTQQQPNKTQLPPPIAAITNITNSNELPKNAVELNSVELKITQKSNDPELAKKVLKLDLVVTHKDLDELAIKSPKSPLSSVRLPHQTSLSAQVDLVEDRKTLRDALYQGIFHRHRRTIFAVGSFLRMLRSRNSQYNTIRSSSGEDIDEVR